MRLVKRDNQAMVFAEFDESSQAAEAVGYYSDGLTLSSSDGIAVVELARDDGRRSG